MDSNIAVVFDLGNVLLPINLELTYSAFARFTEYFSAQEVQYITETEGLWVPYESGLETCSEFRDRLRARFQLECTDSEFDFAFSALLLEFPVDVVSLLQEVKSNFPVYLLSNTSRIHSHLFLQNDSLFSLFDFVHLSYEMGVSKPDKAIYQQVIVSNQLQNKRIVFFDDNKFNVQSAREFGWDAILIDPTNSFSQVRNHLQQYVN
jgi:putative hydrolase of the HAD superfamily